MDVDASLVEIHSERKQGATPHFKRGFGFHPMFCFLDASGEALAGMFRPGNAAANSGADQFAVVDMAIAQLPAEQQRGHLPGDDPDAVVHPILVRADSAGAVRSFIDGLVARNCQFSISARVSNAVGHRHRRRRRRRLAAGDQRRRRTTPRRRRSPSSISPLTAGRPGPGRSCAVNARTPAPSCGCGTTTGCATKSCSPTPPATPSSSSCVTAATARSRTGSRTSRTAASNACRSPAFAANAAWMEMVLCAADLLAWSQTLLFTGELAVAEPRTFRYRILHIAGRLIRSARRTWLRLPEHWPWTGDLLDAYRRLAAIT